MDDRILNKKLTFKPRMQIPFEGRDDLIDVFLKALDGKKPDEYRVLVFHGMSGIGKSRLLDELKEKLEQKWSKALHTTLDFDVPEYKDIKNGLFHLRNTLKTSGIDFNAFDIAYEIYCKSISGSQSVSKDENKWEKADLLAGGASVLAGNPLIALIPKFFKVLKKSSEHIKKWLTKKDYELLQKYPHLKPHEMGKILPVFFAEDIKQHREETGLPISIFVDTYQALWGNERTDANKFTEDEWIRDLVENLPEVYWVIAGHDKICWSVLDKDWDEKIKHYPLAELSEETVFKILEQCGISENDIQKRIFEGSKGVPFYLQLSVESYNKIIEKEKRQPVVDDFGKSFREIFERFARHLDKSEIETLKVLSCARFWDKAIFKAAVKEFNTGYPVNSFNEFCEFSFIREGVDSDTFVIHELFKKHIRELVLTDETRQDIHEFFFKYYDNQLKEIDIKNITDDQKTALTEAFYHATEYMSAEDLFNWVSDKSNLFYLAAQWQLLSAVYEKIIPILEKKLSPDHPSVATSLNNLAGLYDSQGKYLDAEPLYKHALEIREKVSDPDHPDVATSLNNLAVLYCSQGKYLDAEPLYKRALKISEKVLGPDHPSVATSLNNLALLYQEQGKYLDAEPLYKRALEIREKVLGPDHPYTATSLNNLALLYDSQGKYLDAEPLYKRALEIDEKVLGAEHPGTATDLNNLAGLYYSQGKYLDAEPLYKRTLKICEKVLGPDHPVVATSLNNLAGLYDSQGKYLDAEPLYKRALEIREKVLGPDHPDVATSLNNLALLYKSQGKYLDAEPLYKRALEIDEKVLGAEHPGTATDLNNLAGLYYSQGKYLDAEPLYKRALEILEKAFGEIHPNIATTLENMSILYKKMGQTDNAEEYYKKAQAIQEQLEQ